MSTFSHLSLCLRIIWSKLAKTWLSLTNYFSKGDFISLPILNQNCYKVPVLKYSNSKLINSKLQLNFTFIVSKYLNSHICKISIFNVEVLILPVLNLMILNLNIKNFMTLLGFSNYVAILIDFKFTFQNSQLSS